MARGVNKAILIGNLGADPEVKYTANGNAVTNVNVATAESWKDKQTGERQERTEWHRVVFFSRLAEIAGEYLRKGSKVYIEGRIQTRKYQNRDGQDVYTTEIVANDMQMLDSKGGGTGDFSASRGGGGQQQRPQPQQQPPQQSSRPAPANTGFDAADMDDDIPF